MFDVFDRDERDERPGEAQPEFESLEFLPVEDADPAEQRSGAGGDLSFELPDEPPVTVDPLDVATDRPEFVEQELDLGTGTPFELLGSPLLDRFSPDESLDWAFDLDEEDDSGE